MAEVKYFLNEMKNQILVSGSSTKAGMNALITSSKNPNTVFDQTLTAKVSSLGLSTTYVVQNGTDTTSIPIANDQELWVYRGFNQDGGTDGATYRYNPHLHRPYKAYILTDTGSGQPGFPYLPTGSDINNLIDSVPTNITSKYIEKQLAIIGNENSSISPNIASGSFTVFDDARGVHPFVFTKYSILANPPGFGAPFRIYYENFSSSFEEQEFNTSTANTFPGSGKIAFNSATPGSITKVVVDSDIQTANTFGPLSESIDTYGKQGGVFRVFAGNDANNFIDFDVDSLITYTSPNAYFELSVSNPSPAGGFSLFTNNQEISSSLSGYSRFFGDPNQTQGFSANIQPETNDTINLINGSYTYTSSVFTQLDSLGQPCSGSTQFGLYTDFDFYVQYTAQNTSNDTVRIFFTGSSGVLDSQFFDLPPNQEAAFRGLVGSTSASSAGFSSFPPTRLDNGEFLGINFNLSITNPSVPGTIPQDIFTTRWSDVYLSFSQSLSESIDGLYIFNQIPQNDIQVTASVLIAAWTGSDTGSKYGTDDYGTGEYGEGEAGEGPTWQTASIRIYTGSFPNNVPTTATTFLTESIYESAFIHTQSTGVPVTLSFSIPSESIAIKDCLSMALHVSSGSYNSASVENSLVVRNYDLKFITPTQSGQGDGRVPTFIENAFSGTLGFSNTPDCQPLYNNVVGERKNDFIQIVEPNQITSGKYSSSLAPIQLPATGNVDYGGFVPSNFYQILSGSAQKSTVPFSYYTTFRHTYPRYLGSRTTADGVNTIDGLGGINLLTREDGTEYGFGTLPVIDYQTAYFAYCDQVLDPYPVVNNVTQFNLKYLINDSGDALQPNLSPYTAFDVEGTWTEGRGARVGINQVSGSSQYDQLNGLQPVKFVAKEPVAVLWSQTGADTYAGSDVSGSIPLAGAPGVVSTYTASFLSYNMTVQGRDYNPNNANDKIIPETTALSRADQAGQFTFSTSSRYGEVTSTVTAQASSSIISPLSTAPNGGSVGGTATYGNVGEMYFNQDYFAINDSTDTPPGYDYLTGNDLSDVYKFNAQFEFPTTMPQVYRTDAGGTWDKSDYNRTNVGNLYIRLESTNVTGTSNSGWVPMKITQIDRPILRGYFGNNQTVDIDLINTLGSSNAGLRESSTKMYVQINPTAIKNAFAQEGLEATNALYASFIFNLGTNQNNPAIRANKRYRWVYYLYYNNETVDDDRNYWNPTVRPQNLGSGTLPFEAGNGPYITSRVVSENGVSTAIDGALNAPYWAFSQSAGTDVRDHIQLQSPNGNVSYGGEYYQQYIPYTASTNPQFPGGVEPIDTVIPAYNIPWTVNIGDEIKFQNSETQVYTVINVTPPQDTSDNKLVLALDRAVPASINKDFFILRRYRYSPNTVILNSLFPYGGLQTEQRFVEADNISTIFSGSASEISSGFASSSIATTTQSGSYVTTVAPLKKKDNTPTGILFPEFPTADIELEPDVVITDLRDKKLIT